MKTREELERERRKGDGEGEKSFIGLGGAIIIVLGAAAIGLFLLFADHVKQGAPPVTTNSSAPVMTDSLQCDRLVDLAQRDGVVKGDREGGRVVVDEKRWFAMDEKKRTQLIQYVSCAAFSGRGLADLDEGEQVQVVGVPSHKLVATGDQHGVNFKRIR